MMSGAVCSRIPLMDEAAMCGRVQPDTFSASELCYDLGRNDVRPCAAGYRGRMKR